MSVATLPFGELATSADYPWVSARSGAVTAVVIGHCIDLRSPGDPETAIALRLAAAGAGSVGSVAARTDHLLGRFVVVVSGPEGTVLFHDAGATRSVYYAESCLCVASHSALIADLLGVEPLVGLFKNFKFGLPGDLAPTPGVRVLPANFMLDFSTRAVSRFWPQQGRVECGVAELLPEVTELLRASAAAIAERWRPALSLTAGLDSRVTLSAFREVASAITFTYARGPGDATDVRVASDLARRLHLEHRVLRLASQPEESELYRSTLAMIDQKHDVRLPSLYAEAFGKERVVHVRSNLLEIGRAFWRQTLPRHSELVPHGWEAQNLHPPGWGEDYERAAELLTSELQRFLDLAGYDTSDVQNPTLKGYDAWDLFYWEHRMSTWHAQLLLACDPVFETSIIFNSRAFFTAVLAAPLPDRLAGTLAHAFIRGQAPTIARVPFNPPPRAISTLTKRVRRRLTRRR